MCCHFRTFSSRKPCPVTMAFPICPLHRDFTVIEANAKPHQPMNFSKVWRRGGGGSRELRFYTHLGHAYLSLHDGTCTPFPCVLSLSHFFLTEAVPCDNGFSICPLHRHFTVIEANAKPHQPMNFSKVSSTRPFLAHSQELSPCFATFL